MCTIEESLAERAGVAVVEREGHAAVVRVLRNALHSRGIDVEGERVKVLLDALGRESDAWARVEIERDWTTCRCLIHHRLDVEVPNALGCAGEKPGTLPVIRGVYGTEHRACLVEPLTRQKDKDLFALAEYGLGVAGGVRKKYATGRFVRPEQFGAWYCYTNFFGNKSLGRVARLLGPRPPKLRVIRYALLLGVSGISGLQLQLLPSGDIHVEIGTGGYVSLVDACYALLQLGAPDARVGTASELELKVQAAKAAIASVAQSVQNGLTIQQPVGRVVWRDTLLFPVVETTEVPDEIELLRVEDMKRWFAGWGLAQLPGESITPLLLASTARGALPDYIPGVKDRHRVWALHGDNVMRSFVTRLAVRYDRLPLDVSEVYKSFETKQLCTNEAVYGLLTWACADGLNDDSRGIVEIVQAVVGVTDLYVGSDAALSLAGLFVAFRELCERREAKVESSVGQPVVRLNSHQLENALKLARLGLLD